MTLIIAGHNFRRGIAYYGDAGSDEAVLEAERLTAHPMRAEGIFFASDSVVTMLGTRGRTPILSGHRKVHSIPIRLWRPSFLDVHFRGYNQVHYEGRCLVAFAGSTLTAYHVVNSISEHLDGLRIGYERGRVLSSGRYVALMECQPNALLEAPGTDEWADDMFLDSDFEGLLSAEKIADFIGHAINHALSSAKKHRLSREEVEEMRTDFIVGIHCPATGVHKLYKYEMSQATNVDGLIEVFAERSEIPEGDVAVIGLSDRFSDRARIVMRDALVQGMETAGEIFEFLNAAIDEVNAEGSFAIDRPAMLDYLDRGTTERLEVRRA